MGVLTRELSALYQAYSHNQPDPLPALPIQYADYAAWQRRWLTGDVLQAQVRYWERALAGAPALLELPTDRPRPTQQDHTGAYITLELDEALTRDLKALSQRHGVTLFMTLFTAWTMLMAELRIAACEVTVQFDAAWVVVPSAVMIWSSVLRPRAQAPPCAIAMRSSMLVLASSSLSTQSPA